MTDYVYRDGARLTPWMAYVIGLLDAALFAAFGVHVVVSSGIRLDYEQVAIFLERYVTAANINGRYVYDTRVWNGVRYYRISSAGTVAVPTTSNHEIQGTTAAVDLSDTGSDAGIARSGSARSNWLRQNCGTYGLVASGFSFSEAWHYDVLNIFTAVPETAATSTTTTTSEEDDMAKKVYIWNGHVFTIETAHIYHILTEEEVGTQESLFGTKKSLDNAGFTSLLNSSAIHWDAVEAVLRGTGNFAGGQGWSREVAEGEAARGSQETQTKTLEDVLATVQELAG